MCDWHPTFGTRRVAGPDLWLWDWYPLTVPNNTATQLSWFNIDSVYRATGQNGAQEMEIN